MTTTAITMMCLFLLIIWGGWVLALIHLSKHPDEESGDVALLDAEGDTTLRAR